jgi:hypothetical protein
MSGYIGSTAPIAAERPAVKVGDAWTYSFRDTRYAKPGCDYTLTFKDVTDSKIYGGIEGPQHCVANPAPIFDRDLNQLSSSGTLAYRPLEFPLEIGKSLQQKFDTSSGNKTWSNDLAITVVGVENVSVKAGTFKAYRIEAIRKYQGSSINGYHWNGMVIETRWYAPEVKNFVKRIIIDTGTSPSPIEHELVAYSTK